MKKIIRSIAVCLLVTSLASDLSWAYPEHIGRECGNLSAQLRSGPITPEAKACAAEMKKDTKVMAALIYIGNFLLRDDYPLEKLKGCMTEDLEKAGLFGSLKLETIRISPSGVVEILYILKNDSGDKSFIIQLIRSDNPAAGALLGYQLEMPQGPYIAKILPSDFAEASADPDQGQAAPGTGTGSTLPVSRSRATITAPSFAMFGLASIADFVSGETALSPLSIAAVITVSAFIVVIGYRLLLRAKFKSVMNALLAADPERMDMLSSLIAGYENKALPMLERAALDDNLPLSIRSRMLALIVAIKKGESISFLSDIIYREPALEHSALRLLLYLDDESVQGIMMKSLLSADAQNRDIVFQYLRSHSSAISSIDDLVRYNLAKDDARSNSLLGHKGALALAEVARDTSVGPAFRKKAIEHIEETEPSFATAVEDEIFGPGPESAQDRPTKTIVKTEARRFVDVNTTIDYLMIDFNREIYTPQEDFRIIRDCFLASEIFFLLKISQMMTDRSDSVATIQTKKRLHTALNTVYESVELPQKTRKATLELLNELYGIIRSESPAVYNKAMLALSNPAIQESEIDSSLADMLGLDFLTGACKLSDFLKDRSTDPAQRDRILARFKKIAVGAGMMSQRDADEYEQSVKNSSSQNRGYTPKRRSLLSLFPFTAIFSVSSIEELAADNPYMLMSICIAAIISILWAYMKDARNFAQVADDDGSGAATAIPTPVGPAQDIRAGSASQVPGQLVQDMFRAMMEGPNNRRDKFIGQANQVVSTMEDMMPRELEPGSLRFSDAMRLSEMKVNLKKMAALADGIIANDGGLSLKVAELSAAFVDVEAEGLVISIMSRAIDAKRRNEKIILAIDTSWIPGLDDRMNRSAITPLITSIRQIKNKLRSMGLDNISFIESGPETIKNDVIEAKGQDTPNANIIILGSKKTVDGLFESRAFAGDSPGDMAFLAGVDPDPAVNEKGEVGLNEAYGKAKEGVSKWIDAQLFQMLYMAFEISQKGSSVTQPIEYTYDPATRRAIFIPRAKPIDYEQILILFKSQSSALIAA